MPEGSYSKICQTDLACTVHQAEEEEQEQKEESGEDIAAQITMRRETGWLHPLTALSLATGLLRNILLSAALPSRLCPH